MIIFTLNKAYEILKSQKKFNSNHSDFIIRTLTEESERVELMSLFKKMQENNIKTTEQICV